jgi:hypothetical protein
MSVCAVIDSLSLQLSCRVWVPPVLMDATKCHVLPTWQPPGVVNSSFMGGEGASIRTGYEVGCCLCLRRIIYNVCVAQYVCGTELLSVVWQACEVGDGLYVTISRDVRSLVL